MNKEKMLNDLTNIEIIEPQCKSCDNLRGINDCSKVKSIGSSILFNKKKCNLHSNNS